MLEKALNQEIPLKVIKALTEQKDFYKQRDKVYISNELYLDIVKTCFYTPVRETQLLYRDVRIHFTRTYPNNKERLDIDVEITLDTKYILLVKIERWGGSLYYKDPTEQENGEVRVTFIDSLYRYSDNRDIELINDDYDKLQEDILNELS